MVICASAFALLLLVGIKIAPRGTSYSIDKWIDREESVSLRGAAALYIVIFHLSGMWSYLNSEYSAGIIDQIWHGYLAVGLFFFLSGYGISVSLQNKPQYLNGFIKHRIGGLLIPYIICNTIYFGFEYIADRSIKISDVFYSFVKGTPFALYTWFIESIIIFYLIFYFSFIIFKDKKKAICTIFFGQFMYMSILYLLGWNEHCWLGCLCFSLGVVVGNFKEKVYNFIIKHNSYYGIIIVGIVAILAIRYNKILFGQSAVFFVCFWVFLYTKVHFQNRVLHSLGKISLEIYLYHGLVLKVAKAVFLKVGITNIYMYTLASFMVLIPFAWIMNKMDFQVTKRIIRK